MTPPDILLTHAYFLSEDSHGPQTIEPTIPLDMLYLSSFLKSRDFRVEVFDTTFAERDELYGRLRTGRPSTLCICDSLTTSESVIEILGVARLAGWTTIVHERESGDHTQEYLDAGTNFVVLGEAENTMAELLAAIRIGTTSSRLAVIHGIAYLDAKGDLRQTTSRAQSIDLDTQPWPDRKAIDSRLYLDMWNTHHGKSSLPIVTTRGSHSRCVRLVVDEVGWLIDEYQPDQLFISDPFFPVSYHWLLEFTEEIKARNLHISFECAANTNHLNPEIANLLAELGCQQIQPDSAAHSEGPLDAIKHAGLHQSASGAGA